MSRPSSQNPPGVPGGTVSRQPAPPRGFSLVEVTLALGITAFALLAVVGLLPVAIESGRNSIAKTEAAGLLSRVMAELPHLAALDPGDPGAKTEALGLALGDLAQPSDQSLFFTREGAEVPGSDPRAVYRVSIRRGAVAPAPAVTRSLPVRLLVTWPAAADADPGIWPLRYTGSLEAVTAMEWRG